MFRIDWLQSVQLSLLEQWALADVSRQVQISSAINELERRLSLDPINESESRADDERIAFDVRLQ